MVSDDGLVTNEFLDELVLGSWLEAEAGSIRGFPKAGQ